jgi:phosphinothricin acetyltransferase
MGKPLYMHLLNEVEKRGFRCAIGGIGLPNDSSVAFHEACGFTKVGVFKEVGFKLNRWVDVGYWQKLFH